MAGQLHHGLLEHVFSGRLAGEVEWREIEARLTPSVVVIAAYDPRVAGVIAGAGTYRPAMALGCAPRDDRQAVSVMGKAFCMVDTAYGAIRRGDLLVASPTQGHAMRASDRSRAFGATLGKALRDFEGGRGTIPVFITLR